MRHVIVGTAGHVDHGKTSLIRALTGENTDRWEEEQRRGLTIDIGFAQLEAGDDFHVGIVDVPGHERFIKNMLAGIGGIDLVLLVVALDEGVMPQTREHFEILKALSVQKGILVFTKKDMVDKDWADLVIADTEEYVKGTFLEHAPHVLVSSATGEGIDVLRSTILETLPSLEPRSEEPAFFRLPVDRVFSVRGFGTVVTGTLVEGKVALGDEVQVYPEGPVVRVRSIQNHNVDVEETRAGERTAINLSNIKREELSRGAVLARPDSLVPTYAIDCEIQLFDDTKRVMKNRDRVHVAIGTDQRIARVYLFGKKEAKAGETVSARLQFDEMIVARRRDHFIVRFYSPVETFAGGLVADPAPVGATQKARGVKVSSKEAEERAAILHALATGTEAEALDAALQASRYTFPDARMLALKLHVLEARVAELLAQGVEEERVLGDPTIGYVNRLRWDRLMERIAEKLDAFHAARPLSVGMDLAEFLSGLQAIGVPERALPFLFANGKETMRTSGRAVSRKGFQPAYSKADRKLRDQLLAMAEETGVEMPKLEDVAKQLGTKADHLRPMAEALTEDHLLQKVAAGLYLWPDVWDEVLKQLRGLAAEGRAFTLAEFRDALGTSRKYAVNLLETFDHKGWTRKEGDVRYGTDALYKTEKE